MRGVTPATTPEDQLYPAAGQWKPFDNSIALWDGWIETNVPCNCIMNFSGDPLYTGNYDETTIPGTTPDEIRAEIVKDAGGLYRSCLLYTSPSPRDATLSRMPSSA